MRIFLIIIILTLLTDTLIGQTQDSSFVSPKIYTESTSSLVVKMPRFKPLEKQLSSPIYQISYVSVPLIACGAILYNHDTNFRSLRNDYIPNFRFRYDDYLQYMPMIAMYGMKAFGVEGRSSWGRMLVSDAFSAAIMAGLVNGLKYSVKKERPDGSKRNSFPSGHSATAFMAATMLHKEYGLTRSSWYSIGGYTVATAVAISRQMNNKHWLSDVMAGAGIGIFSTELGYYLTDLIFKDKGLRRKNMTFSTDKYHAKPSFLGVNLGINVMAGKVFESNGIKIKTGVGTQSSLEGAYFFNPYFGAGGCLSAVTIPYAIDETAFTNYYPMLSGRINSLIAKPFSSATVSVGPYFAYPLSMHWSFGGKFLLGTNYGDENVCKLSYKNKKNQLEDLEILKNKAGLSFGMTTGISILRIVNHNLGFRFFTDYTFIASRIHPALTPFSEEKDQHPIETNRSQRFHYLSFGSSVNILF